MSLRGRIRRLFAKFDRRVTLVEDEQESTAGATLAVLEIVTELKAATANLTTSVSRIEVAVTELSRTIHQTVIPSLTDERERRAGVGRELMRQGSKQDGLAVVQREQRRELDQVKARVVVLENGGSNGAAE